MYLFTHSLSPSAAGTMWTLCFQALCASFERPGGEAAVGREGDLEIKTSGAPEVLDPLLPLFQDSLGRSSLVRPGRWHMVPSHLSKEKNQPPTQ